MSDERLTEELAVQVMGWKAAPGRYIKSGRAWTPSWRFSPLTNLEQAFVLLERAASTYTISKNKRRGFEAEVHVRERIGKATGVRKARTITIALARALGLKLPDDGSDPASVRQRGRNPRRSNGDGI